MPGLLSSSGNTLISANQLKRQDGIGYSVPGDEFSSSLYTGNPRNPTREIVLDTMPNGLDCLTPLPESAANHLVDSGYFMRDFTSSPVDVTGWHEGGPRTAGTPGWLGGSQVLSYGSAGAPDWLEGPYGTAETPDWLEGRWG